MGHTTPWPPEREDQLEALVDDGLPINGIAERMGLTKGAVIGKMSRLRRRAAMGSMGSMTFERRVDELFALHASRPLPIQFPSWGRCQWPEGDIGAHNFRFCGAQAVRGGPYCQEHTRRAR